MAGPSVMVQVLGDVAGLGKSFATAQSAGQKAAAGIHQAFGTMLSTLNSTGVLGPFGDALNTANNTLQQMGEHTKDLSGKMIGLGGGALAVGVAFSAMGSKDQAAHQQLQAAIAATGKSYSQYGDQIEAAIKSQAKLGNTSAETQTALMKLTAATHDPAEAVKLLSTASDLAAAKHIDLASAATQVGKVYNGNTKLLKEYGIVVDKHTHLTAQNQTATVALSNVLKGQAAASVNTFSGHMHVLSVEVENQAASYGQKYGPALTKAGAAMAGLGSVIKLVTSVSQLFKTAQEAQTVATDAATVSNDALNVSLLANPLVLIVALIAVAIAAIVAIMIKTGAWKDVVNDTWAFIKLAFADIKAVFMDVWNFIAQWWPLLAGILLGPFGLAAGAIYKFHDQIIDAISGVIDWMTTNAARVFSPLWDAAKFVWDTIAKGWNDTIGSLNFSVPSWVPFVGGKSFGFPKIPMLEQGGYIAATGMALVHEGETVIPKGGSAPAVHIEHAHFAGALDVDAFMSRVAFHARLARL